MDFRIVSQFKFSGGLFSSSLGLLPLLLSIGIGIQPLGAAPLELPSQEETPLSLEEVARPVSKPSIRDLFITQHEAPPLEGLEGFRRVNHRAQPGDSLAKLFFRFGLSTQERQLWLGSVQKHHPVNGLRAGKEIHFYFTRADSSGRRQNGKDLLRALEIDLDDDWILAWEKGKKGIIFSKREKPYDVELKTAGGVLEGPLFEDGARFGLNQSLFSQLADIFSWDIDFNREMQKGDTFKLLYEEKSRKGRPDKTSFRILAAELISAGQQLFALYFEKQKGKGAYYDLDGRSLARAFLRFPLEFTNISSYFSHSRFHPILKIDRPHYGVDFTAKRGTPIRAIGEGKILHAGWVKGGYGRMIELQHDSVYTSRYAHLQGLAKGIRKGMVVKKGQIIGYVGSSGRSTGPHLHFELYRDQEYLDPLKFEFPPEDTIEPFLRRAFEDLKRLFLAELAAPPHT